MPEPHRFFEKPSQYTCIAPDLGIRYNRNSSEMVTTTTITTITTTTTTTTTTGDRFIDEELASGLNSFAGKKVKIYNIVRLASAPHEVFISTNCRKCLMKGMDHKNNHAWFKANLQTGTVVQGCHDAACKGKTNFAFSLNQRQKKNFRNQEES
ncbi:hypothetical protein NADE_008133 [Nannochloris sp. 'desiccata']|nr:hypothetical protein NADE_008133 [Chlorella desiccata (nom. nud.)]